MHDFRKLRVWDEAMHLATLVYVHTAEFPRREQFGLTQQLRRAAVSVSSNIAEGAGRGGRREMARFVRIALGSLAELDSQAELAVRLGYLDPDNPILPAAMSLRHGLIGLHSSIKPPIREA